MRIGAVNYLNSKPLVYGLDRAGPPIELCYDLPSRLADRLAVGQLDVALVPSIEWLREPESEIVSDACVACRGPVLSVKLYFRVPPAEVTRLALDEGSRTSAALAQILLEELAGVAPQCEPLPIGLGLGDNDADAVLLIGDRAITSGEWGSGCRDDEADLRHSTFIEIWDLGERWTAWTGLPFVFAMWVAVAGTATSGAAERLAAARDEGLVHLAEIAAREAPGVGVRTDLALRYFRDNLHFRLGVEELSGLRRFGQLCADHGLIPPASDTARSRRPEWERGLARATAAAQDAAITSALDK